MPVLDHWNPELGSPGDDLSAIAENRYRDYSPGFDDGPDDPARLEREAYDRERRRREESAND